MRQGHGEVAGGPPAVSPDALMGPGLRLWFGDGHRPVEASSFSSTWLAIASFKAKLRQS